ncbi:MAG: hypothetical protein CVU87_01170 [Firmicutes bacterium HGW-Firmicutes-12]|jgi:hypothetical protein|nr:MAG: hypothetical protein CVU87_01170 [Firmicutes bacterium HGW-Firmicutes-12]
MPTTKNTLIQGIGIAEVLPQNPVYFTEIAIPETVTIPEEKPDMEMILSCMVEAVVISIRLIQTPCIKSYEGQLLSGRKLIIELKLDQKITYVANVEDQSEHSAHFENLNNSVFVVVPQRIANTPIEDFIKKGRFIVTPYIEDIYCEMLDSRTVFKNITLLLDVTFPV